jgi:hypothetical protein
MREVRDAVSDILDNTSLADLISKKSNNCSLATGQSTSVEAIDCNPTGSFVDSANRSTPVANTTLT